METQVATADDAASAVDVLLRLRRGDRAALADLAETYGRGLVRAAYLFTGDAHIAEDAAQESLIAAWDGARRTDEGTTLRSWLYGILFNQCRKRMRSLGRLRKREEKFASDRREASVPPPGVDASPDPEVGQRLRRALDGLDDIHRMVVILRYERGLGVAETARALSIPEGTVKSRTHAAAEILRAAMKEGADESRR